MRGAQPVLLLVLGPAGQTQTLCFSRQVHTKLMKLSPQTKNGEYAAKSTCRRTWDVTILLISNTHESSTPAADCVQTLPASAVLL
jgi:hypothetical protein